ncbi:MAG: hypothetical protein JO087_02680, partial [Actinobacteria bacterium]|nr:hypothetical protein [Actinomycetota bacterium]
MSATDAYVAAVRSLIQHLPTVEREEILEDLTSQLNEEAAEPGIALEQRLGTPSAFAAEFVESLGVVSRHEVTQPAPMVAEPTAVRRWWSDVAPAWWMLRPFVIAGTIVLLLARHREDSLTRLLLLALGAVVAASAVSWSRRQGVNGGRWNLALSAVGVVAALAVGFALVGGADGRRSILVRPVPAAAIEMKCAMVAKQGVIRPPVDSPKVGPAKPFAPPDVPP